MNNRIGINQIISHGVKISIFDSVQDVVKTVLKDGKLAFSGSLVALNPEKLLSVDNSIELKKLLNTDPISYVDGIGLSILIRLRLGIKVNRVPGCEIWEELMKEAGKSPLKVFLIGSEPKVITSVANKVKTEFNVNVCGYRDGYFDDEDEVIKSIIAAQPDIICVAMGSPRQEAFMYRCSTVLPDKLFMGVGGTFDVHSGKVRRAPQIMRSLNLEWLFRACLEPRLRLPRLMRIIRSGRRLLSSEFRSV